MALQQHPYRFSSHPWHQFTLHCLRRNQPYRPARLPRRGRATHHGNDLLPFLGLQQRLRTRSRFVVQRSHQSTLFITLAYLAHCVHHHSHIGRHLGRTLSFSQLAQHQGASHRPNRLDAGTQQRFQFRTVFCGKLHLYSCAEIASLYLAFSSFSAKYLCGFLLPSGQSTSCCPCLRSTYLRRPIASTASAAGMTKSLSGALSARTMPRTQSITPTCILKRQAVRSGCSP